MLQNKVVYNVLFKVASLLASKGLVYTNNYTEGVGTTLAYAGQNPLGSDFHIGWLTGHLYDDDEVKIYLQWPIQWFVEHPRWKKGPCAHCKFVGWQGTLDVYECDRSLEQGYIWQYGDQPWEYYTWLPEHQQYDLWR